MKLFIGYPYSLNDLGYRAYIERALAGSGATPVYADERISSQHVLDKIRSMMADCDSIMFDLTDNNPNVMLELGIAIGSSQPFFVTFPSHATSRLISDLGGWDSLRYDSFEMLSSQLRHRIEGKAIPLRVSDETTAGNFLDRINFGELSPEKAQVAWIVIPLPENRRRIGASLFQDEQGNAKRISDIINGLINTHPREFDIFWPSGLSWATGEDYFEVYMGRNSRNTVLRLYANGAVLYWRLIEGSKVAGPVVHALHYRRLWEAVLLCAYHVWKAFGIEVGSATYLSVFSGALNLRLATYDFGFIPSDYRPLGLRQALPQLRIPTALPPPLLAEEIPKKCEAIASEMVRILLTKFEEDPDR